MVKAVKRKTKPLTRRVKATGKTKRIIDIFTESNELLRSLPDTAWRNLYGKAEDLKPAQAAINAAPKTPKEITDERGKTHGDFRDHARITQALKRVVNTEIVARINRGQSDLTDRQEEFLDMLMHKVGRIIAGNADFADHYDDIAGYAYIAIDR